MAVVGRRRVAIVWFVPEPWRTEINGIRRAAGDSALRRVDPHVTLVPPLHVDEWEVADGLTGLAAALAHCDVPMITLGPVGSFNDESEVTHLNVGGDLPALHHLRDQCFVAPFDRPDPRPYRPHATIAIRSPRTRVDALIAALGDAHYEALVVDGVDVVEFVESPNGPRWTPIARVAVGDGSTSVRRAWRVEVTTMRMPGATGLFDPFVMTAYVDGQLAGQLSAVMRDGRLEANEPRVHREFVALGIDDHLLSAAHRLADECSGPEATETG
jgi:2'-5' RNA ligase